MTTFILLANLQFGGDSLSLLYLPSAGMAQRLVPRIIWRLPPSHVWWLMLAVSWNLRWAAGWATYIWLLHVVWASLQRGGGAPRASFSRENEPDGSHLVFYDIASEVLHHFFRCFYSGEGIDFTPLWGGSRSGRACGIANIAVAIFRKYNLPQSVKSLLFSYPLKMQSS